MLTLSSSLTSLKSCQQNEAVPLPSLRLRRLRQHPVLRDLMCEHQVTCKDLILPLFIKGEKGKKQPIPSMPGHDQIPLEALSQEIEQIMDLGLQAVILFGVPPYKDACGSNAYADDGIIQNAIHHIRKMNPALLVISDICCCEYTDHGHCGFLSERRGVLDIDNDTTLQILAQQAVSHAQAGADVIAPSGMIDGMVQAIRYRLDQAGFSHLPILSYSVKYNSSMYGPFRLAAEGAPAFGDRSTHMLSPSNSAEALRETELDVQEGADMLMVKPAHTYLDIIAHVKRAYPHIPLGAYHTSGEFGMLKAAADKGWIQEKKAVLEVLTSIRRAGADFIITYYAKEFAQWLAASEL